MASAAILDLEGKGTKELPLEDAVFGAEVRPHLVHEAVRAEMAAARSATRGGKSRGMVAGGRSKPWRQKGTGRARQGTTRAPQWTGGGQAFPPNMRDFGLKMNRKARKAALRSALSDHATRSAIGVIDGAAMEAPSSRSASALLAGWGAALPVVVVCTPGEENVAKSFRNLARVVVVDPATLEVGALVWARSLLVTEAALPRVQELAR